jgi:hypothetical protein
MFYADLWILLGLKSLLMPLSSSNACVIYDGAGLFSRWQRSKCAEGFFGEEICLRF